MKRACWLVLALAVGLWPLVVQATVGLPIVVESPSHMSGAVFAEAAPDVQSAYIAGLLDAFLLLQAEGAALREADIDPEHAYHTLVDALARHPNGLSVERFRAIVLELIQYDSHRSSVAVAFWQALAVGH